VDLTCLTVALAKNPRPDVAIVEEQEKVLTKIRIEG